jgi:Fe-S-cluster containining protein
MYYERHALRFSCTGCGYCCTGRADTYYIEVSRAEQRRIQGFLGVSWAWLRRRYVRRFDQNLDSLRMEHGRCVFLGPDRRCTIYSVRPAQCRHYPYWPELVGNGSAWRAEAKRCEGIGRGDVVPLAKIKAALKKQQG